MAEHTLEPLSPFTSAAALEQADAIELEVPRGEPRQLLAAVAAALAARELADILRERLAAAADAIEAPGDDEVRLALAYRLSLPYLARDASIKEALADVEPLLDGMDEEERVERGPVLGRAAAPALAVDLELLKDEGYRFVATFPPEGSEGIDVVGKAAAWLTIA